MNTKNSLERVILDLETKKGFDEVGKDNLESLGVSVVGIYSYKEDKFRVFLEKELEGLLPYLRSAKLIIGFNIKRFDHPVLQPYLNLDLASVPTLDILEEIQNRLGFRLSLNNIAQATLKIGKVGTGLDALKYFRQGKIEKLIEYCQHDVFITREVYEYGRRHGQLLYFRGTGLEAMPVSWAECKTIKEVLEEAYAHHRSLEIEYLSKSNPTGPSTKRKIDIYGVDLSRVIAYCHLRKEMRTFNIRRILSWKIKQEHYTIPPDFNLQEFKTRQSFLQ